MPACRHEQSPAFPTDIVASAACVPINNAVPLRIVPFVTGRNRLMSSFLVNSAILHGGGSGIRARFPGPDVWSGGGVIILLAAGCGGFIR